MGDEFNPRDVTAAQAMEILQTLTNQLGMEEAMATEIRKTLPLWHRTLQQGFVRMLFAGIETMAKMYDEGDYDLRNEAACKKAKLMMGAVRGDIYLPLI